MKKILFLLLCTVSIYGQTSTGQEQSFPYGIVNESLQTITTPTYIGTFGTDGTQGKIPSAYIAKTSDVADSLATKENVANKSDSYTASSSTTYASTKALVDGLSTKAPLSGSANYIQNQNAVAQSANMWIGGSGTFNGNFSSGGATPNTNPLYVKTSTNYNFRMVQDGGVAQLACVNDAISEHVAFKLGNNWLNFNSSGAATFSSSVTASNGTLIGGTLTSNYIPKATGANSLGNSLIYDDGTNVGIGTTSPTEKLHTFGSGVIKNLIQSSDNQVQVKFMGTLGQIVNNNGSLYLTNEDATSPIIFRTGSSTERMRLNANGNLSLGSDVDNGTDKLQVNGSTKTTALTLATTPTTSAGTYDILTRNTSTGVVEKKLNADFVHTTGNETKTGNLTLSGDSRLISVISADNGETGYASLGTDALGLPYMQLGTSSNENTAVVRADNINTNSIYQLPNSSGTIALEETVKPYKVYTALLSQSGTSAPTATVLENTLGGTIVWTRVNPGIYSGTLTGAFTTDKTILLNNNPIGGIFTNIFSSVNTITIQTRNYSNAQTDDGLSNTSIEILVYN